MSNAELDLIIERAVDRALSKAGFLIKDGGWVTENYALTHLLKPHRIGRKRLEYAMYVTHEVEWKHRGRNVMIKRESITKFINQ